MLDISDLFRDSVTIPIAFRAVKRAQAAPLESIERITRRYRDGDVMPPCDTLESLDTPECFPKSGATFGPLDANAHPVSGFDAVQARDVLFHSIGRARGAAA